MGKKKGCCLHPPSVSYAYGLVKIAIDSHSKLHITSDGFSLSMSKLFIAQGSANSSTGSTPCSTTPRIPSSEQIIAGRILDDDDEEFMIFEECT